MAIFASSQSTAEQMDPFRDYVQALYDNVSRYLNAAILHPLNLEISNSLDMLDLLINSDSLPEKFNSLLDAYEYFGHRLLVLGEPNTGKTISLLSVAQVACETRLSDSTALLPVMAPIEWWDSVRGRLSLIQWFCSLVGTNLLESEIEQGKVLFLLDGLEDLAKESFEILPNGKRNLIEKPRRDFITVLNSTIGQNTVVLTCRTSEYSESDLSFSPQGTVTLQKSSKYNLASVLAAFPHIQDRFWSNETWLEMNFDPATLSHLILNLDNLEHKITYVTELNLAELRLDLLKKHIEKCCTTSTDRRSSNDNLNEIFSFDQVYDAVARVAAHMYMQTWKMYCSLPVGTLTVNDTNYVVAWNQLLDVAIQSNLIIERFNSWSFCCSWYRDVLALDGLIKYLESPGLEERLAAARGLGILGNWRAAESLRSIVRNDNEDIFVRYAARVSLDKIEQEHTVFISYRRKDWPTAYLIANRLEGQVKANIFIDRYIDETNFERSLMKYLRQARVLMLIVTENTFDATRIHNDDDWIKKELEIAIQEHIPIVLVSVDKFIPEKTKIPLSIRQILDSQAITISRESVEDDIDSLITFLAKVSFLPRSWNGKERVRLFPDQYTESK